MSFGQFRTDGPGLPARQSESLSERMSSPGLILDRAIPILFAAPFCSFPSHWTAAFFLLLSASLFDLSAEAGVSGVPAAALLVLLPAGVFNPPAFGVLGFGEMAAAGDLTTGDGLRNGPSLTAAFSFSSSSPDAADMWVSIALSRKESDKVRLPNFSPSSVGGSFEIFLSPKIGEASASEKVVEAVKSCWTSGSE